MPETTEIPAAPPRRNREAQRPNPPAPPESSRESLPMPQLPDSVKQLGINIASEKQTIAGDDRTEQEKMEQAGRLGGRKRMTEEREGDLGWEKKFSLKRLGKRIWQDGIHQRALYAREKATAQQMMAEGRLQGDLPYQFQRDVREVAQEQIVQSHSGEGRAKRLGTRAKDFLKQATLAQRELHKQEVATMRNLRLGLQYRFVDFNTITDATQRREAEAAVNFINAHQDLFTAYQRVLTGEYQASEGLAQRLSADMGDDALRAAIGEKKAEGQIEITGDLKQFFTEDVIAPLLREGLQHNGNISEETLLDVRTRVQDVFMTQRFAQWRNGLTQEQRQQFDVSLSYGTDVIPMVQQLLPDLMGVKDQLLSGENLNTYLNEITLKANIGTLKSGAETTVGETTLERWTSRQLTNRRVARLYNEIAAGREQRPLHPNSYNSALEPSAARANALNDIFKFGGGSISAGLIAGAALYAAQRGASMGGRMVLPIFGGAAVTGGVRALQEGARYTREVEQHRREVAEGAAFPDDARRRQEMERFNLPMINIRDAIRPMMQGRQALENGNASVDDISRLLGALADRQARIGLMNTRGVDLYRTTSDTSLDAERTRMELENVRAMRALHNYFDNNQHAAQLRDVATRFGVQVNLTDVVGSLTGNVAEMRRNNLVVGNSLDANIASAFGGSVAEAESIVSRDQAMRVARRWAMTKQGVGAFGAAAVGGLLSQEAMANILRGTHELGINGSPHQTVLEKMLHIGHEPKPQHFPPTLGHEVTPSGKLNLPTQTFNVDGAKIAVQMPKDFIPAGSHVVEQGNHFFLVNGEGKHLIGMHLGKDGQPVLDQVKGGINLHDLNITATTEQGKPITEHVTGKDGIWNQHATNAHWEGYANDTPQPDLDELKFHTLKMDHTIALVPQNMQTSFEHGLIPPSYYVPNVEHSENMWYDFLLGGKTDNSIQVQAPSNHGILLLNPDDHNPNHTYMTGSGKRIQAGLLARMILNQEAYRHLPNGDIATELNGHENVFNLAGSNGDAGVISQGTMRDGAFQSFASIHGTGGLPENLTTPGTPTYHIEIIPKEHVPGAPGRTENPIDVPFFPGFWPRRPLEAGEETTGEPLPEPPIITRDRDSLGPQYGYEFARNLTPEQVDFYRERRSERLKNDPKAKLRFEVEVPDYFRRQDPEYMEELEEYMTQEGMNEPMHEEAEAIVTIPVYTLGEGQIVQHALEEYLLEIDKTKNADPLDPNKFELILFLNHPADVRENLERDLGRDFHEGAEERVRNGTPEKYDTEEVIRQFQEAHPELKIRIMKKEFPTRPIWGKIIKPLYDVAMLRAMRRDNPHNIDPIIITNDIDLINKSPRYLRRALDAKRRNEVYAAEHPETLPADAFVGKIDMPNHGYENYPGFLVAQRLFQFLDLQQRRSPNRAPITQGRNSMIRASTLAGIGGANDANDAGADTELGRMVEWARGDSNTIEYVPGAWLESDSRRELTAWRNGMPLGYAWDSWGDLAIYGPNWQERFNDPPEDPSKLDKDFMEREIYFEMERWGYNVNSPEIKHALSWIGFRPEDYHIGQRQLMHPRQGEITVNTFIIDNLDAVAANLRNYIGEKRWQITERRIQRELGSPENSLQPQPTPQPSAPPTPPGDEGTPPARESTRTFEERYEQEIRDLGRAAQQRLTEQSNQLSPEDPQITALRNAGMFLRRDLDAEEREIVINNPDNWGEELAWRMAQRERQRTQDVRTLEEGRSENRIMEDYFRINPIIIRDDIADPATGNVTWESAMRVSIESRGDTFTPEQGMQEFVFFAQNRGSTLTTSQLENIYRESVNQGRLVEFRVPLPTAPEGLPPNETPTEPIPAVPAEVERIDSSDNLLDTVNTRLESAANAGRTEQTLEVSPQVFAEYLRNSGGLFSGVKRIDNLDMNISNDELHISGKLVVRRFGMDIPVTLTDVPYTVDDHGELVLVPETPNIRLDLPEDLFAMIKNRANRSAVDLLREADQNVKNAFSRQTPGWSADRFSLNNGNIGVQFRRNTTPASS